MLILITEEWCQWQKGSSQGIKTKLHNSNNIMNIYIYSSCSPMFIVYHPYICPHFDWWLQFHHIVILVWVLQNVSVVCKFQLKKHNFPYKHASINLSIDLLRLYMLRFQLTTKWCPLSTNVLYFHIQLELVEGGFVSNMCSFVQFHWPMIIRCRNIKKKRNLLI